MRPSRPGSGESSSASSAAWHPAEVAAQRFARRRDQDSRRTEPEALNTLESHSQGLWQDSKVSDEQQDHDVVQQGGVAALTSIPAPTSRALRSPRPWLVRTSRPSLRAME